MNKKYEETGENMDDIKNKRKRNIAIEAAMKDIKDSLTGKHARGILGNIEQNLRCAYRRGYADAQEEYAESNVQKHDDSLIKTNNELVSESDVIYRSEPESAVFGSLDSEMPEIKSDRTTGDLISRQDVINQIALWKGYLDEDMIYRIQLGLKRLPSAKTEFKIYVVSWITCGVPVVTAFDNYDAAKACYDAFKTKEGKCLDRVSIYSNFIDYGEIENE